MLDTGQSLQEQVMDNDEIANPSEEMDKIQEAQQILMEQNQKRVAQCNEELQLLLSKYNCTLDVSMIIKPNQIIPQVQLVPIQPKFPMGDMG
jgi:hypothetical protein